MSMLAEPRKKQKIINLRAKNNAWSNDSSKFGQRMLEKMGWSVGKGLGAKENGIVEHVVAKYKNDDKGFGYKDTNDQWVKHEEDFNKLLANLSNEDSNTEIKINVASLEDKSKKSKARVHYQKFTRGKDLSRYSEKDLANIFGKKSLKDSKEESSEISENNDTKFKVKGSIEDYFKSKTTISNCDNSLSEPIESENADFGFSGFSQIESYAEVVDDLKAKKDQDVRLKKKKRKHKDSLLPNGTEQISADLSDRQLNKQKIKKI